MLSASRQWEVAWTISKVTHLIRQLFVTISRASNAEKQRSDGGIQLLFAVDFSDVIQNIDRT